MDISSKITKIKITKKSSHCEIYLDNGEIFDCSTDLILKYHLSIGTIIDENLKNKIELEQELITSKQIAFNYASYKPRTEYQVRLKLKEKGITELNIEASISFLIDFKLINDENYANMFLKDYSVRKPSGKQKLIFELIRRGINKELAQRLVNEFLLQQNNNLLIETAFEKKIRSISYKPIEKQKSSIVSYLLRQGFDWDLINNIVNNHFKDK